MTVTIDSAKDGLRLGKKPALQFYSEVGVKFEQHANLKRLLPLAPSTVAFGSGVPYRMYLNDAEPDCTCAGVGHLIQQQTFRVHKKDPAEPYVEPADPDVEAFFTLTGRRQGLSNNDGRWMAGNGAGVLDVWKSDGINTPAGVDKIVGYAAVAPASFDAMHVATWLYGGMTIGIALPTAAYYQLRWYEDHGKTPVWSVSTTLPDGTKNPGSWAAGSWGGHEISLQASYTSNRRVGGVTWARRILLTLPFLQRYQDEGYVVLSQDWLDSRGGAPNGANEQDLIDDMRSRGG